MSISPVTGQVPVPVAHQAGQLAICPLDAAGTLIRASKYPNVNVSLLIVVIVPEA
jgi:hypothetical protein